MSGDLREGAVEMLGEIPEGVEARGGIERREVNHRAPTTDWQLDQSPEGEARRAGAANTAGKPRQRQEGNAMATSRRGWLSGETLEEQTLYMAVG
jgi:hypothetical protein